MRNIFAGIAEVLNYAVEQWIGLLFFGMILSVSIISLTGAGDSPKPRPVIIRVEVPVTATCDPRLVAHDLAVMKSAYDLLLDGDKAGALDEIGNNYAALSEHECE